MEKSLRNILEKETVRAEKEIMKTLQAYHDETGLIPATIDTAFIDVSDRHHKGVKKINMVSVSLKANT